MKNQGNCYDSKKGLFWIICRYYFDEEGDLQMDFSEAEILAQPISKDSINIPSHWDSWASVNNRQYKHQWNYYPRGRAEIRQNRAVVFANPLLFQYEGLERQIRTAFSLSENITIVFKADNSAHYACAGNNLNLL